ncbi:MAG TPA: PASTA domain-containing protein [Solirubrobacterales bacterium]|nr:PASTA domain-containing protein [Solirubrobacterales bacterium]
MLSAARNALAGVRVPRCALLTLCVFALLVVGGSSSASAEPPGLPAYDGMMTFPQIDGPTEPEEYSWEVQLHEEQVLKQIDERHAVVYYGDERHAMFSIAVEPAHDAIGTTVPTTLTVSGANIVTLTVHHRTGNPTAGGASFSYPVMAGAGWEGGFSTVYVDIPDEPTPVGPTSSPTVAIATCIVPELKGRSLKADQTRLTQAGCRLGKVRGKRSRTNKVVKQDLPAGTTLPAGAKVGVKLGD